MVAQDAHPASLTGADVGGQDDQKVHRGEINRGGVRRHLTRPGAPPVHLPTGGSAKTPAVTPRTSLGNGIVFNS
ncbi:hypothetical protein GCM10010284_38910 [Streptomyces rubiginosohelvolus]|uniref:Uncharacterized protein n=1 Tax=Streptomyces rubiginosohelvolus TaxID=67362 RepID=A0ABQ3C6T4_9ACTN|nr:hypothetical protein GCM10010284_38910 [Streptomyces rubiginosohelvolus]GGZ71227.1 hypothetical protein GCM10010328_52770 [Streptomyces pluricolorescens]